MKNQFRKINKLSDSYYKIAFLFIAIQLTTVLTSAQTKDSPETQTYEINVTGVEYGTRGLFNGKKIDPSHLAPSAGQTQFQFSILSEELKYNSSNLKHPAYLGFGGSLIEVATGFDSGIFVGGQLGYIKSKYTLFGWSGRMEGAFDPQLFLGFRQTIGSNLLLYRLDYRIYNGVNKFVSNSNSSYSNVNFGGNIIEPSIDLRHQLNSDFEFGGRLAVLFFGKSKSQNIFKDDPTSSTTSEDKTESAYSFDVFAKYKMTTTMDLVPSIGISRGGNTKSKVTDSYGIITEFEIKDQAKLDTIALAMPIKINEALSVNPQISKTILKYISDESTGDTTTFQITTANVSINYGF